MKRLFIPVLALGLVALMPTDSFGQDNKNKDKDKVNEKNKFEEYDEIIIRQKKSDADAKVTVEIKDGDVIVNGKPVEDFEDENVSVKQRKARVMALTAPSSPFRNDGGWQESRRYMMIDDNQAFLGVSTEEKDCQVVVNMVTENSAAAKAGLQKGDVITKVDDIKIEKPQDLVEAIGKYKPEEKVTVGYMRDGKDRKVTATLGKREGNFSFTVPDGQFFRSPDLHVMPRMENFDFKFDMDEPRIYGMGGRPRLGIRAQDTEDGKGVKVLDVADESAADEAGIKEDDVILEFDGKAVNSADELISASRDAKDKSSYNLKISRDGKTQNVEVKIPKKLKTANL